MLSRVAHRFIEATRGVQADHIGDLNDLLAKYREKVARFERYESVAKSLAAKYEELERLMWKTPMPTDEMKAIRDTIPGGGEESPYTVANTVMLEYNGVRNAAKFFCWGAIQQVVLTPKLRKSIEAAAKFWAKEPRVPKGGTVEKTLELRVKLYLNSLEAFRKYDKLFALVVKEGRRTSRRVRGRRG